MDIKKVKQDLKLIRDFSNFELKIYRYREIWNKSEMKSIKQLKELFLSRSSNSQCFEIPYYLPGNCEYALKIDIEKLKTVAKEIDLMEDDENILNKYFRGKDYLSKYGSALGLKLENEIFKENNGLKIDMFSNIMKNILEININNIDKEYAKTRINSTDPILCLDMSGIKDSFPPFCIVDGNHQAYGKTYFTNLDKIETYIISRNIWIQCLLTESDKAFIKILNNISCMLGYMNGSIETEEEANKYMYDLY